MSESSPLEVFSYSLNTTNNSSILAELKIRWDLRTILTSILISQQKHTLWPLSRTVSLIRFYWGVTMYVFMKKYENYPLITPFTPSFMELQILPMLSVWKACWGRRKHVSTFWPVRSSKSVWNFSIGWAWFSDNQSALRFKLVTVMGRYSSL